VAVNCKGTGANTGTGSGTEHGLEQEKEDRNRVQNMKPGGHKPLLLDTQACLSLSIFSKQDTRRSVVLEEYEEAGVIKQKRCVSTQ
jgi:hypothetical protein